MLFSCLFQCFEEKEYQTESKHNETFGRVIFGTKTIQETWSRRRGSFKVATRQEVLVTVTAITMARKIWVALASMFWSQSLSRVNNIFFPAHPYFDTTAPMLTRRPLAPAAPRRLPRHRLLIHLQRIYNF